MPFNSVLEAIERISEAEPWFGSFRRPELASEPPGWFCYLLAIPFLEGSAFFQLAQALTPADRRLTSDARLARSYS